MDLDEEGVGERTPVRVRSKSSPLTETHAKGIAHWLGAELQFRLTKPNSVLVTARGLAPAARQARKRGRDDHDRSSSW